jgi:hypothetical protein
MRRRIVGGVVLGLLALVAFLAPFSLMLLRNPTPVVVMDISAQSPGTFIETHGTTYHVFPRAERVDAFPADVLSTGATPIVWVRYRQLAPLQGYTISSFPGDTRVAVRYDTTRPRLLGIVPKRPLPPGRYYAVIPRESLEGGEDYYYFTVAR